VISIESNLADFGRFSRAIDGSDARSPAPKPAAQSRSAAGC
jgi:hypothetical protein